MMEAYGWVVVRVSREAFANKDLTHQELMSQLDVIDDELDAKDEDLWRRLREYLGQFPFFKWDFTEQQNNARGVLQFLWSTNHRGSSLIDLIEWIATNGTGSYGLIYVYDDEDTADNKIYGRGDNDYSNEFRVWRILNGGVSELDDPFLSPIVPKINPNEFA